MALAMELHKKERTMSIEDEATLTIDQRLNREVEVIQGFGHNVKVCGNCGGNPAYTQQVTAFLINRNGVEEQETFLVCTPCMLDHGSIAPNTVCFRKYPALTSFKRWFHTKTDMRSVVMISV